MRIRTMEVWKYISLSVLGMLGASGTILADTFFVSNRLGSTGLAALNIAISIFGLLNGVGILFGMGGATRYAILKSRGQEKQADSAFTLSLLCALGVGAGFLLLGLFGASNLARALGASGDLLPLCSTYLRTVLYFAPFFIANHFFMALIRNDGNPKLAMCAMVSGSLANIILDYLFLYPLHLGIFGAALATGLSPLIGLTISSLHGLTKRNQFHLTRVSFGPSHLRAITSLGLSAFVNELSSSLVLVVFNLLLLNAAGTIGVAAYGIVANLALVVLAVFTGIAQGLQPLLSRSYGTGHTQEARSLLRKGQLCALLVGIVVWAASALWAPALAALFNSAGDPLLQTLAEEGLVLYFGGFLFLGYNYMSAAFLSATERGRSAFWISLFRGCVGITVSACLMARFWGVTGIWLSFPVVELGTLLLSWALQRPRTTPAECTCAAPLPTSR